MVDVSDCSLSHEDGRTLFGTDCYIPLSFRVIPKIRLSHSGSVNSGSVPGPRIKESDRPRDYVIVLDKVPTIALSIPPTLNFGNLAKSKSGRSALFSSRDEGLDARMRSRIYDNPTTG